MAETTATARTARTESRDAAPKRARRAPDRRGAKPLPAPTAPIVKWAGGKSKLVSALKERMPSRFRRYFEPFVGGGALFFRTAPSEAVLGDRNADLINTYRCIAWNVEAVIRKLAGLRSGHSNERYYEVRERWNDAARPMTDVARAATFIYLNKTCFNGLWRVNSKGRFNVPVGRYDDPSIFDAAHLREASRLLQRATLVAADYREVVSDARAGDLVYFDPPYAPLSATSSFTSYTAADFAADDQAELADIARRLDRNGVHVMISNSDTPGIRELYRGFRVEAIDCARAINSVASRRGAVSELIITGRS